MKYFPCAGIKSIHRVLVNQLLDCYSIKGISLHISLLDLLEWNDHQKSFPVNITSKLNPLTPPPPKPYPHHLHHYLYNHHCLYPSKQSPTNPTFCKMSTQPVKPSSSPSGTGNFSTSTNTHQIRIGNYTLLETIGVGSFGKVKSMAEWSVSCRVGRVEEHLTNRLSLTISISAMIHTKPSLKQSNLILHPPSINTKQRRYTLKPISKSRSK